MEPNHDVIDEKSAPAADASKPPEASRTKSDDEISIVDSDGPTITRSRPGYDNPLRKNPPTPHADRSRNPIKEVTFVALDDNASSVGDASAKPDSEAQFPKDIIEQLEDAFHIQDEEVSILDCLSRSLKQDEANQVENEKKLAWGGPDQSADACEKDSSKDGTGHENLSITDSLTSSDARCTTMFYLTDSDEEDEDTSSIETVMIPNTDGSSDMPKKSCLKNNRMPKSITTSDFTKQVEKDLNISETRETGEESKAPETKKTSFWKFDKGKQPAKSCLVENKTSSGNDTELKPGAKRQGPRVKFKIPENPRGKKDGSKWNIFSSSSSGTAASPEDRAAGKKSRTASKTYVNSSFFFGTKKYDGYKTRFPVFSLNLKGAYKQSYLEYKVDLIRSCTNTYVELLKPNDTTSPRRINDNRVWHSRNLRCASCEGFCPICDAACCIYKASKEVLAKPKGFQTDMCSRLMKAIDRLGSKVKDTSTFSMCTLGGGCGRRVCPKCCGMCPTAICRDIQCKECKSDPWAVCDWHDA
ncbi:hypothetical protein PHISCL_07961 [Aspergillus sclerotialis]|uniref:Uncharacterized protein n=1 Tax=Aspergillus sclerotialis TaxID=2070753 RepID=A0A3A2Z9W8_9EURO|nr:hypothetical protein PHISCL_07961 [Aspergillus sclerotialis]